MSDNVIPLDKNRPAQPLSAVEGQLIGAVLDLGDASLIDLLGTDNVFTNPKANIVWLIIKYLADKMDKITAATVHSLGFTRKFLSNEDLEWLAGLQAANTLTAETFAQIAGNLRRAALGRQLAAALAPTLRELANGNFEMAKVIDELDAASGALARSDIRGMTAASDTFELAEKWEHRESTGQSPMMLSRIKLLDEATGGGFPPKFGVLMGDPGVGKNMVLAGMILAQLEADKDLQIGLFALEDGSRWLLKRWVALRLGIPVGDVGIKMRTPEQRKMVEEVLLPYFHELLLRVHTYRFRKIKAQEMLLVSRGWIHQKGVREILFDNLTHLDTKAPVAAFQPGGRWQRSGGEKKNEAVAEAVDSFAELADAKEIPIIALAHTIRVEGDKAPRPPKMSEVADSAGIERNARFAAGMWRTASRELRLTIQKNTEGPGTGTTIELERIIEAATIEPSGGRLVNIEQEAREQKKNRENDNDQRIVERRKARAAAAAEEKAAAQKKADDAKPSVPPQMTLLDGGASKPPEEPRP